jgi:hypothetical protein
MIVNRTEDGWELIYQQAHALLAAKLVTYWHEDPRPDRWTETLNAIAQHDNGWQEWESGARLMPDGSPRSFLDTPPEDVVLQAERVVTRAWHQSLWVGLLVSQHISHLHESRRGEHGPLDELLDMQVRLRAEWAAALGVSDEEVLDGYSLLRWGDTCSLILCRHLLQRGQIEAVAVGPDGTEYQARMRGDGSVTIAPWPYILDRFPVSVDSYRVYQEAFADDGELAEAIHVSPPRTLEWMVSR